MHLRFDLKVDRGYPAIADMDRAELVYGALLDGDITHLAECLGHVLSEVEDVRYGRFVLRCFRRCEEPAPQCLPIYTVGEMAAGLLVFRLVEDRQGVITQYTAIDIIIPLTDGLAIEAHGFKVEWDRHRHHHGVGYSDLGCGFG